MLEGMRDMTKSNLVWIYSELATPFALTSLQNVRLVIDVVRCFVGLTIGFGAGIIFLGRAFRNPVTQLPTPSPVRRMYRGKLTRIDKVILSTVLLTRLWGYLAKWVLSPDNAFGPLVHFCAMAYWASVGIKKLLLPRYGTISLTSPLPAPTPAPTPSVTYAPSAPTATRTRTLRSGLPPELIVPLGTSPWSSARAWQTRKKLSFSRSSTWGSLKEGWSVMSMI